MYLDRMKQLQSLIDVCERIHNVRELNYEFGSSANAAKVIRALAQELMEHAEEREFLLACFDSGYRTKSDGKED